MQLPPLTPPKVYTLGPDPTVHDASEKVRLGDGHYGTGWYWVLADGVAGVAEIKGLAAAPKP